MFPNLRTLIVSPQQLNSYIVLRLAESRVTNLHIVQDHYCDESYIIERETWKRMNIVYSNESISLYSIV